MFPLLASLATAACPPTPALRDPDGRVTVLEQNLKFIFTGERRQEREQLLFDYLDGEGSNVDILLLSEARLVSTLENAPEGWCFYTQASDEDGYRWAPLSVGRSPGGLAMGLRQRDEGEARSVSTFAGRPFRARATTLAEGLLGRIFNYRKGWAALRIDDTQIVWSHTQASYKHNPHVGAGSAGRGRVGQFEDLAKDLGRPAGPTLLTGDLNLLAGFKPARAEDEARVKKARDIDDKTLATFQERTGLDFSWPWEKKEEVTLVSTRGQGFGRARPADDDLPEARGTFAGTTDRRERSSSWDRGAAYDRVGVNAAFLNRHAGMRVRRVEIAKDWLRVSDHLGLEIEIPFSSAP